MIDVRRLRVLKAVVESGSVSGAAAYLNYTPSAVSQSITALERETGTVLLERAGRGIRPTDAGLLLCEHAGRVLATVQQAEEALSALRAGRGGRVPSVRSRPLGRHSCHRRWLPSRGTCPR